MQFRRVMQNGSLQWELARLYANLVSILEVSLKLLIDFLVRLSAKYANTKELDIFARIFLEGDPNFGVVNEKTRKKE